VCIITALVFGRRDLAGTYLGSHLFQWIHPGFGLSVTQEGG
jgi:hypothetical protein